MKSLIVMCLVLLMISLVPFFSLESKNSNLEDAKDSSITVDCSKTHHGYGSGVIFKNKSSSFVWTDAHVIVSERLVNGKYTDVLVTEYIQDNGRKVGENSRFAKIIRVSQSQDIALLYIYEKNYGKKSVRFSTKTPNSGDNIWHIGSFYGPLGMGSVAEGNISSIGRLRYRFLNNETNPDSVIYDQVSTVAYPGSSGGGVFSKNNGDCFGLISHFLFTNGDDAKTHSSFCMIPSRRIIKYAHDSACLWAVDNDCHAPSIEDIEVITN